MPTDSQAAPLSLSERTRRFSLMLLISINLLNYIDRYILSAIIPLVQKDFFSPGDASATEKMGWLQTAFLLSYMGLAPVLGWLADRVQRWVLIGICVIFWSLACGASGLAATFGIFMLTRILIGVGEAGYGPAAPTLIADLYPAEKRGKMLAWFYVATPVGSALGFVLGGTIGEKWGWQPAFFAVVIPGLLLGLLCFFFPDPKRNSAEGSRKATWTDYLSLLRNRSYVLDCLGLAAMTFSIGGIAFWMPTYVHEFRHVGTLGGVSMTIGAIAVISGLAGTLAGSYIGDKLRARFPGSYFLVSGVGMLIGFPLFLSVLWVPFPAAWVLLALAEFFLFLNTGPSNAILANVTRPSIRATAFALNIFVIHALGDAISPPLIGKIAGAYGRLQGNVFVPDMNVAFEAMSAMILLSGVLWVLGAKYLQADTDAASA